METRHLEAGWVEESGAEPTAGERQASRLAAWLFGATVVGLFLLQFIAQLGWHTEGAATPPRSPKIQDEEAAALLGAWRKASQGHPALGEGAGAIMPAAGVFYAEYNAAKPPSERAPKDLRELRRRLNVGPLPPR